MDLIYEHDNLGTIWQAGYRQIPSDLKAANFDLVIYAASECPPLNHHYGAEKKYFPNYDLFVPEDSPYYKDILAKAKAAVPVVVKAVLDAKNVLVTCAAGINRSSLITCLSIRKLSSLDPQEIIDLIRSRRPGTLSNDMFVEMILAS